MDSSKLETISNLFEGKEIRSIWDSEKEEYFFSVVDVVGALTAKDILRLIESIPSPKAEPFKIWLANVGNDRINEVFDPEIAVNRAVNYYRNKGYTDEWIKARLIGIVDRFKLTDVWKSGGITKKVCCF